MDECFSDNSGQNDGEIPENVKAVAVKALDSLARAEQCRTSLERKLVQKGFEKNDISAALDYLESKNFLNDGRYASMWLRTHCVFKFHGKIRLLNDLLSRGVKKSVADKAVSEYLEENPEIELCRKAYKKYVGQGKSSEKVLTCLAQSGFSYNMIQKVMKMGGAYAGK